MRLTHDAQVMPSIGRVSSVVAGGVLILPRSISSAHLCETQQVTGSLAIHTSLPGLAAELGRQAEVQANRFGVADVQITVWLRGEARVNPSLVLVGLQVVENDIANSGVTSAQV